MRASALVHSRLASSERVEVSFDKLRTSRTRVLALRVSDKLKAEKITCFKPASGVVTALEPILQTCNGIWVAHGSGDERAIPLLKIVLGEGDNWYEDLSIY